mgnify:CR=1 FL=1
MENKEIGGQIEDNDFERLKKRGFFDSLGQSIQCLHCYCGRLHINNKEHMVCCMCGHRALVNSITY